jgi:site-specific recombinase XerC
VRPFHVAAYIEQMPGSKPTIKQKLAAIRMLYDFLVIRQLVPVNPTASVRGPKYVVKRGKTRSGAVRTLRSFWNPFRAMIWPGCATAP